MMRSQKRFQHLSPELRNGRVKSDCLAMLSLLPESMSSRISAGALAISMSFSALVVEPPDEA